MGEKVITMFLLATLTGASEPLAPEIEARRCFQFEVDLFEAAKNRLPDPDETDLIIDMCMSKWKDKNEPKTEPHN